MSYIVVAGSHAHFLDSRIAQGAGQLVRVLNHPGGLAGREEAMRFLEREVSQIPTVT